MKTNKMIMVLVLMLIAALAVNAGYYTYLIVDKPELVVTYMSQDPDPVEPGGYIELKFKIENEGAEAAENVLVEIIPEYPFSLDAGEKAVKGIGIIRGRQTGSDAFIVKFKLKVDKDAVSGDNTIDIKYSSDNTGWVKLENNIVNIRSKFAILSITDIKSEPEIIKPGEIAKLAITFENMADALLKNIKVNLLLYKAHQTTTAVVYQEQPFTPIKSSNEKTLRNLERGEKAEINFDLMADPDAEAGVYKIPLIVTYTDNTGKNFSISDNIIGLVIGDAPDLVIFIETSELKAAGTAGNVDIKFINKGTSDIKFLYVTLKESDNYNIISPENVYVGDIDSDDYESAEYKIYLKKARNGEVMIPLYIEYRDANNRLYKKNIGLPLKIISAKMSGEGNGGSKVIGFLIIIAIVAAGIFIYRRRKRKKK